MRVPPLVDVPTPSKQQIFDAVIAHAGQMPGKSRAHNLSLVHALVGVAWAHDEAQLQTKNPKVIAALRDTSDAAASAAGKVERDQLEELTPRQRELVAECQAELVSS